MFSAMQFTHDLLGEQVMVAKGGTKACTDCLGCGMELTTRSGKCRFCLGRGRILVVCGVPDEDYQFYVALCNQARKSLGRSLDFTERETLKDTVKDRRRALRRVA